MGKLVQLEINFNDEVAVGQMTQEARGPRFGEIFAGTPIWISGDELKEQGMSKALSKKASQEYREKLIAALSKFPVKTIITVERLTAVVGRPPEGVSSSAIGAAVNTMAKRGLIRQTGKWVKPERKERHSTKIPEWEVLKYA